MEDYRKDKKNRKNKKRCLAPYHPIYHDGLYAAYLFERLGTEPADGVQE
jgi:hypothetical protein